MTIGSSLSRNEHIFHIIMTILTAGVWILVYGFRVIVHLNNKNKPDTGEIKSLRVPSRVDNKDVTELKRDKFIEHQTDIDFLFCECSLPNIEFFTERTCKNCQRFVDQEVAKNFLGIVDERTLLSDELSNQIPAKENISLVIECNCKGLEKNSEIFECKVVVSDSFLYILKRRIKLKLPKSPRPWTKEVIPYSQITGLDQSFKMYMLNRSFHLKISRANNVDELFSLSDKSCKRLMEQLEERVFGKHRVENNDGEEGNIVKSIERLADLFAKGLITEDEFEKAKKVMFGRHDSN